MRTKEIKVYTIEELSESARERAIKAIADEIVDLEWWDFVYGTWQEKLPALGFDNAKITFSAFNSQGNGATFHADINLENFLSFPGFQGLKGLDLMAQISSCDSHYCNENSHSSFIFCYNDTLTPEQERLLSHLRNYVEWTRITACKEIYVDLMEDYTYMISDENCTQTAMEMEYEFTEDGIRI